MSSRQSATGKAIPPGRGQDDFRRSDHGPTGRREGKVDAIRCPEWFKQAFVGADPVSERDDGPSFVMKRRKRSQQILLAGKVTVESADASPSLFGSSIHRDIDAATR